MPSVPAGNRLLGALPQTLPVKLSLNTCNWKVSSKRKTWSQGKDKCQKKKKRSKSYKIRRTVIFQEKIGTLLANTWWASALSLGLLKRYLVLRYRCSQILLLLLQSPCWWMRREILTEFKPCFGSSLFPYPFSSPLLCFGETGSWLPSLLSYTFCAGAVIRQVGAGGNPELQNSGCQNQSWKKPKQYKSSLPWSRCQVTPKTSDSFMLNFWDSGNPSSGLSEEGLQLSRTYNTLHSACLPLPESRSLCPGDWGSPSGAAASCLISAPYS